VTGAGTRTRDLAEEPHEGLGLFKISSNGKSYSFLCGNDRPTSEMPSHVAIHQSLEEARPEHRAIVHTHPPHLIAATHIPEFQDSAHMADMLLRMQSEASLHLVDGLVHLPYHLPGSLELGLASADAVRHCYIVLWHFHGALATGRSRAEALDFLQYLDKAAEVYWILRSAGIEPQGMRDEDIQRSLKHFGRLERYWRWKGSIT
jgi:rhamnulose-1-phosphate aldolase